MADDKIIMPDEGEDIVILIEDDDLPIETQDEEPALPEEFEEVIILDEEYEDIVGENYIDAKESLPNDLPGENDFDEIMEADADFSEDDGDNSFWGTMATKMTIVMGVVVAILAIFVGIFLIRSKFSAQENVDFSQVGINLLGIGIVGGDNIEAITQAQGAKLEELYEAVKNYDYDEADEATGVTTVDLTLTSILKDLKIKFVNKKDKLIANVPFQVEISDAKGKTETITDTDKDGIIYLTDLSGGSYSVRLIKLEGYDTLYDFDSFGTQMVSVKDQLEYKKVNVTNEIKKVTDTVSAKEDTKIQETVVESKLTDTVDYVMSSKTLMSDVYKQIDRTERVTDPVQTLKKTYEVAALSRFYRLADTTGGANADAPADNTDNSTHEHSFTVPVSVDATHHENKCSIEGCQETNKQTVECTFKDGKCECGNLCSHNMEVKSLENGTHQRCCKVCGVSENVPETCSLDASTHTCTVCGFVSKHVHEYTYSYDGKNPGKHTATCKNSDGLCTAVSLTEGCTYIGGSEECSLCKQKKGAVFTVQSIEIKGDNTISFIKDSTTTVPYQAAVNISDGKPVKIEYKWEIIEGANIIAFADENRTGESVSVKAVEVGKAKLQCSVSLYVDENNCSIETRSLEINVVNSDFKLSIEGKKLIFVNGDEVDVVAFVENGSKEKLKWTVTDSEAVSVSVAEDTYSAKVKALGKVGTNVTVTVALDKDDKVYKKLEFVVLANPKEDKATKLLDNDGKQLFVYEADTKKYREAVYADYYSGVDLYIASTETYKYTGWWKLDGKTYYFDANGKKVTGDQVISGAKYSFDSEGALKSGTGTFGIDVSVWNGIIDWNKVAKSGVDYAIIRCGFRGSSEGGLYEDSKFAQNISNASKAGIKLGVYFFTQAITEAEAVEEASMCLNLISGYSLTYPVFIDVESSGGRADSLTKEQRTNIVSAFCKTISNSGYKAGVYANKSWLEKKLDTSSLAGYTIWLAQYASKATYTTTRYDMWQYSAKGSVSGISGDVDLNLSYVGY